MIGATALSISALPILLSTSILVFSSLTEAQKDNGNQCDCFRTNCTTEGYYAFHRFHDFRNVDLSLTSNPKVLTDATNTTNAEATSAFFSSQAWTQDWQSQSWNNSDIMSSNNATVFMINSPNNIYIEKSTDSSPTYTTYLTLRTTRTANFQSAAEFSSTELNFHYLSTRFLARVTGSPGACAGLFTYLPSTPVQEADIEILTSGPRNAVQYTNQPSNSASGEILPDATANRTLPFGLDWSAWNAYRLDWTPSASTWYVNGVRVAGISFQVPRDPAGIIVNLWSDGGPWTGSMGLHDEAFLQIQYVEVVFNTSGPYAGGAGAGAGASSTSKPRGAAAAATGAVGSVGAGSKKRDAGACKVVCGVDEGVSAASVGTPALLYNNTDSGVAPLMRQPGNWAGLVPGLLVGVVVGIGLCL